MNVVRKFHEDMCYGAGGPGMSKIVENFLIDLYTEMYLHPMDFDTQAPEFKGILPVDDIAIQLTDLSPLMFWLNRIAPCTSADIWEWFHSGKPYHEDVNSSVWPNGVFNTQYMAEFLQNAIMFNAVYNSLWEDF